MIQLMEESAEAKTILAITFFFPLLSHKFCGSARTGILSQIPEIEKLQNTAVRKANYRRFYLFFL